MHPILVSQKLEQVVKSKEVQPPIINQQCMDNSFSCQLRNADYISWLHNDRFHPCETPCLTHLLAFAFNQVLSFSVVLDISGSPNSFS